MSSWRVRTVFLHCCLQKPAWSSQRLGKYDIKAEISLRKRRRNCSVRQTFSKGRPFSPNRRHPSIGDHQHKHNTWHLSAKEIKTNELSWPLFFFFNFSLKTDGQSIWFRTWVAGMHLEARKLSNRNLHIQRPRLISQALTSWLSPNWKSNWRWLQTIQCQLIVPGGSCQDQTSRECLRPLVLIFRFVSGRMLGLVAGSHHPFPHPTGHFQSDVVSPGSPHSQFPETSDENRGT